MTTKTVFALAAVYGAARVLLTGSHVEPRILDRLVPRLTPKPDLSHRAVAR